MPLDRERLSKRDDDIEQNKLSSSEYKYAFDFANADVILIGAPFWDLNFPSLLKIYIENICVKGITFAYDGKKPVAVCKAKKLIYITTSGGYISNDGSLKTYLDELCCLFCIPTLEFYKAEGLSSSGVMEGAVLDMATP